MHASVASPIDDYLRLIGSRLRGPARLKADLLAEARGSLEDATEAYTESGLDRWTAQRRAVADFGGPDVLAPAYQAELTAGQGRRLALTLPLLPVSMLTADLMWWKPPAESRETPPPLFLLLVETLDWTSYAVGVMAMVALFLLGPAGRRWAVAPRAVARPLAVTAVTACALIWSMGTFAAVNQVLAAPQSLTWPPMIAAWVMLNAGFGLLSGAGVRLIAATGRRAVAQ